MCGIAGMINLDGGEVAALGRKLKAMSHIQKHRGPDGHGIWRHESGLVGFAHQRLSIIDLSAAGAQPMTDRQGNWITYNGEIYNYKELRRELGEEKFASNSDTETILMAYRKWGADCPNHLRGMFSFALWDESEQTLFCVRDRFGIKPFYYSIVDDVFYFASEAKTLLPMQPEIATDLEGFKDYLTFQFCLPGKTMFKNIKELPPAHCFKIRNGEPKLYRYWDIYFEPDFHHTASYFKERLDERLTDSVSFHLRSDVPVGAYISGGLDSSVVAALAAKEQASGAMLGFVGKFAGHGPTYDESAYARLVAEEAGFPLYEKDINAADFISNIAGVIRHLDYPVAGPGSFSQYMVSSLAAQHRKVVLGGQGGDEIFGGYTRYLVAYFEQCIKGAIDGTLHGGNFLVTYESIIPNLESLRLYKPMLKEFWSDGLFEPMDRRYFHLVNRAKTMNDEIDWAALEDYSSWPNFDRIFNGDNVKKASYFDLMTNFDFKTLLPALLHVEDRMSMAHGLESRVPLLDHQLVELASTVPADIKFKTGEMKHIFREVTRPYLPSAIVNRKDKMGFPTPVVDWMNGEAHDFVRDIFSSDRALNRDLIKNKIVLKNMGREHAFSRKSWGLLCLELWQREFHDQASYYKGLINDRDLIGNGGSGHVSYDS
jgi:asparagine synthase (glutamine-hydrolysing)